jgi:hypothetical protein
MRSSQACANPIRLASGHDGRLLLRLAQLSLVILLTTPKKGRRGENDFS